MTCCAMNVCTELSGVYGSCHEHVGDERDEQDRRLDVRA